MSVSVQLDELDIGIIRLLAKDGRMSFTEISNKLGVTEKTIRSRFHSLRENDILDVVGVVNPISLGLKTGAIIQLAVDHTHFDTVIEMATNLREIRFITLTSGEYQLIVQVHMRTYDELAEFMKTKLMKIPGITKSNLIVQLEIYKNTFEYL